MLALNVTNNTNVRISLFSLASLEMHSQFVRKICTPCREMRPTVLKVSGASNFVERYKSLFGTTPYIRAKTSSMHVIFIKLFNLLVT